MNFGIQAYQRTQKTASTPIETVIHSFDQMSRLLSCVPEAFEQENFEHACDLMMRVNRMLTAIRIALSEADDDTPLIKNLDKFCVTIIYMMLKASNYRDKDLVAAAAKNLSSIAQTWRDIKDTE